MVEKKSRRTTRRTRRTKKGGASLDPADKIGSKMTAEELFTKYNTNPQKYIGHILRCDTAQEAGKISKIIRLNEDQIIVYFTEPGYNNITNAIIQNKWEIYIQE